MVDEMGPERAMTYGERAVRVKFNPSRDRWVDELKRLYARIIDICDDIRNNDCGEEKARLCAIAIIEAQTAQMWAVHAATWPEPPRARDTPSELVQIRR